MNRAAKEQLRKSRAARQAGNYAVNKHIKEFLKAEGFKEEEIKKVLKDKELKEEKRKLTESKATNKELKAKSANIAKRFNAKIKNNIKFKRLGNTNPEKLAKEAARKTVTSGPFDSYVAIKGWRVSAIAAGNRLERAYPGFFQAMKTLETKGVDVLWFIFEYYNIKGSEHDGAIYEMDENYTVAEDYQLLCRVAKEQYDVDLPGSASYIFQGKK